MKMLFNFPLYDTCLDDYGTAEGLAQACAELGCDGVEAIWEIRITTARRSGT